MWGQGDATSFSQCTQQLSSPSSVRDAPSFAGLNLKRTLINHSSKQTKIAWKTTYAYTGGFAKVKSCTFLFRAKCFESSLTPPHSDPLSVFRPQRRSAPGARQADLSGQDHSLEVSGLCLGLKISPADLPLSIHSMYWTYTTASNPLVADVSYDLWLSDNNGKHIYEIMIWLSSRFVPRSSLPPSTLLRADLKTNPTSRGGAGPAGGPIGTTTIAGYSFTLYKGIVGDWTVSTFSRPESSAVISPCSFGHCAGLLLRPVQGAHLLQDRPQALHQ
jgi:hypothetical protein